VRDPQQGQRKDGSAIFKRDGKLSHQDDRAGRPRHQEGISCPSVSYPIQILAQSKKLVILSEAKDPPNSTRFQPHHRLVILSEAKDPQAFCSTEQNPHSLQQGTNRQNNRQVEVID
jgi:hypothetical protein